MDAPEYYSDLKVELGIGSYGTVYRGHRKQNKQYEVAVKSIMKNLQHPSHLEKDKKEIQILKSFSGHENVVEILDLYESQHFFFIIMEFCDLNDVTKYVKERKPSIHSKVSIMYQCANAIEYMHNLKPSWIHRDIKPANILMKSMGNHDIVKLADFGMAKIFDSSQKSFLSGGGAGTHAYDAPELFDTSGHTEYTPAVDVFSLGMVFLVLLNYGYTTESLEPLPECLRDQNGKYFGEYLWTQHEIKDVTPPAVFSFNANDHRPVLELKTLITNMLSFDSSARKDMYQIKIYLDQLNSGKMSFHSNTVEQTESFTEYKVGASDENKRDDQESDNTVEQTESFTEYKVGASDENKRDDQASDNTVEQTESFTESKVGASDENKRDDQESEILDQFTDPMQDENPSNNKVTNIERKQQYEQLLERLGLDMNKKIQLEDLLLIDEEAISEISDIHDVKYLPKHIAHKIMNLNYKARCTCIASIKDNMRRVKEHEETAKFLDFLEDMEEDNATEVNDEPHPSDVLLAMLYCSDMFVQQYFVTKFAQCQVALPFLIHNPSNFEPIFPLWMLRPIQKRWCTQTGKGEEIYRDQPIISAKSKIFSFMRFGSVNLSKSELMNSLLNRSHEIFIHRNSQSSNKYRCLQNGVAEFTWYLPSGKKDDLFPELATFVNFRGDAEEFEKQIKFICNISSAVIIILSKTASKKQNIKSKITELHNKKVHVLLIIVDISKPIKQSDNTWKYGVSQVNKADMTNEIQRCLQHIFHAIKAASALALEDCAEVGRKLAIACDEDDKDCTQAKKLCTKIMAEINNKEDISSVKETFLPLQGKAWQLYTSTQKELSRLNPKHIQENESIQEYQDKLRQKLEGHRNTQSERGFPLNSVMKAFIEPLSLGNKREKQFFIKWMKFELDILSMKHLSELNTECNNLWDEINDNKKKLQEDLKLVPDERRKLEDELQKKISVVHKRHVQIYESSLGIEHFLRELSQLYECCKITNRQIEHTHHLPEIAANLLLQGQAVELMDGDAVNVPKDWISSVFTEVSKLTKPKNAKNFVLTILGIQSSGKSTLLNMMFGLEFTVSVGRCTRGAFMLMLNVSSTIRKQLGYDYVLIIDTEGLRAPELSSEDTLLRDNELATFVIGLGDITLINIFGENPSDINDVLQIVVQAFLRMKQVNIKPRCYFVHQNVAAVDADEKLSIVRRQMMEKLDNMTRLAAEHEGSHEMYFNEVISFDENRNICYLSNLWQGDPPMAPPNPGYSEKVKALKRSLLNTVQEQEIHCLSLNNLTQRVQDLWKSLLSENFVFSFKNTLEITAYRTLEDQYIHGEREMIKCFDDAQSKAVNVIKNASMSAELSKAENIITEAIESKHEEIKETITKYIEENDQRHILIQWKGRFLNELNFAKDDLKRKALKHCKDHMQAQEVCTQIDRDIANHENIFLVKARKLAKNVTKDKSPSDQFDKAWAEWQDHYEFKTNPIEPIDFWKIAQHFLHKRFSKQTNYITEKLKLKPLHLIEEFTLETKKHIICKWLENKADKYTSYTPGTVKKVNLLVAAIQNKNDQDLETIEKDGIDTYSANATGYFERELMHIDSTIEQWQMNEARLTYFFYVDLSMVILKKTIIVLERVHETYMKKYDPKRILEGRKDEIYDIFLMYVNGVNHGTVAADIMGKNIMKAIWKSFEGKVVQEIKYEATHVLPAISGNRFTLDLHMKKYLVQTENFDNYMKYINQPKDFVEVFVSEYIDKEINLNNQRIFPQIKITLQRVLTDLLQKCEKAQTEASKNSTSLKEWENIFLEEIKQHMVLVSIPDTLEMGDFPVFSQNIRDKIKHMKEESAKRLDDFLQNESEMTLVRKLVSQEVSRFCKNIGCWECCPFCHTVCTSTLKNHEGKHRAMDHRPLGVSGTYWEISMLENIISGDIKKQHKLVIEQCTTQIKSRLLFAVGNGKWFRYSKYKEAGPPFSEWDIIPDDSFKKYWKWFCVNFKKYLKKYYGRELVRIPEGWYTISKGDVLKELELQLH